MGRLIKDYTATETCVKVTITYLGFMICLFCVIYQGVDCMTRLLSNPEAIDLEYGDQINYQFPALTFCPIRHGKKVKDLIRNPNEPGPWPYDLEAWRECNNTDDQLGLWLNYPGPNERCMRKNLYKRSLVKLEDFHIKGISVRTWRGHPKDDNNLDNSVYWTEWNQLNHGTCFTMHFKQHILDQGIWFIMLAHDVRDIMYTLTIHTDKALQDPSNSIGGVAITVEPGTSSDHTVEFESVSLLHYNKKPCNPDPEYNMDQCALNKIDAHLLETFGCASPFGNYTDSDVACADIDTAKAAEFYYFDNQLASSEQCPYPCTTLWNKVLYSNKKALAPNEPETKIRLAFPKFVKASNARYVYQIINFIGEFGGVIGLFLGFSIMQLTDVLIWLSREIIHWANRNKITDFKSGKKGPKKPRKQSASMFNRSANLEATLRSLSKIDTDI